MTTKPEIGISLRLTGEGFLPAKVTPLINIVPTRMWRVGDSVQGSLIRRRNDGSEFALPRRETYDMEEVLKELLDVIDAHRDGIERACERFRLSKEISFEVRLRGELPASWFSAESVRRVADLHASLDIDMIRTEA